LPLGDLVAAVAERSQVAVALTAEPFVGEVVDLEPPRLAAPLAAPAGQRDRTRAARPPVRRAQVHVAIPRATPRQTHAAREAAGAQQGGAEARE
jgi:hypothetical protein